MAYNRTFNPDSLPAFAEPERKGSNNSPASSAKPQQPHPTSYAALQQQQHQQQTQYTKPAPPLPADHRRSSSGMQSSKYGYGAPQHQQGTPQHQQQQQNYGYASPPPGSNYGNGPRPAPAQNRPPPASRPPQSPAPSNGADPAMWPLFKAVDKDGTGHLSEKELRAALVNGDWTSFDPHTVKMMIRMFDSDRSGSINFEEFCGLWGFLAAWRSLFDRFDSDRSGNISLDEYTNALVAFGYRLSPQFVEVLFRTFDKRRDGAISFDLFVQSCISLKRMTDVFKKYDDDRDGYITLSFEDFLLEIIKQK
ncbi:hypothetical protein B2J93_7722 [Marssonina coronariae]|uniref:EF-hand domain-containing protein n=1 Tax=Diplocarpon coronariae TaxID=2795749 RepID=A0A218ZG89_9HELO|nr:hypothetical protein B2J93_7722 [Marssonina coronariae]